MRLGLNASPEPFTNIVASIGEDFAVAVVTALALQQPELAAADRAAPADRGIGLAIVLWKAARRAWRRSASATARPPRVRDPTVASPNESRGRRVAAATGAEPSGPIGTDPAMSRGRRASGVCRRYT